jgi:hypothetical protein
MGRASIAYTNKDYESLRRELLARVPQLTDRWTDFNASDLGVVLLELFCGIGDMLAYYLDAQAAEAFLPTARQRQNVINLCKLISYRLDTPVAATTTLRFALAAPLDEDLTIPAGTACRARLEDGDVEFETALDAVIPRGRTEVDVDARQGRRKSESFTGNGEPGQRLVLAGKSIAQGSIRVRIQEREWTEVAHFQESDAGALHFQTETDALDETTIVFGDGVHGAVPPPGEPVEVEYLETLGAAGNLGPNLVTEVLDAVYLDGAQVALSVTNPAPATNGADRETLEHARRQAPAELRSLSPRKTTRPWRRGFPASPRRRSSMSTTAGTSATTRSTSRSLPTGAVRPPRCSSATWRSSWNPARSSRSRSTSSIRSTGPSPSTRTCSPTRARTWTWCAAGSRTRSPNTSPSTAWTSARRSGSPTWWP